MYLKHDLCSTFLRERETTMKTKHLFALLALVLAMCLLFVSCDVPGSDKDTECEHTNTITVNAKKATCSDKGYSGDIRCNDCDTVITKGHETATLDHSYSDWNLIIPPTEENAGLQQRTCKTCGVTESDIIAKLSGEIAGYDDLIAVLLGDVLGITSGEAIVSYTDAYGETIAFNLKTMKAEDGYHLYLCMIRASEEIEPEYTELYYENGEIFVVNVDGTAASATLEEMLGIPYEEFKATIDSAYPELETSLLEVLDNLRSAITDLDELFGEEIDTILADLGIEYSVDELYTIVNTLETILAEAAEDLGFDSKFKTSDDIIEPSTEDYELLLSMLMTSEEIDGVTVYSLSVSPLISIFDAIHNFVVEHADDTLAEVVYLLVGDIFKSYDEELTDFDAIIDFIAREFNGSLTIADAVNKFIDFAEQNGFTSIDAVYSLIDKVALHVFYEEFDSAQFIADNGDLTLNDLAKAITDDETADIALFYDEIKEAFNGTYFDEDGNLADSIDIHKEMKIEGSVAIAIDAEGNIIGFEYSREFWFDKDDDPETALDYVGDIEIGFFVDDSIVVEIPDDVRAEAAKMSN